MFHEAKLGETPIRELGLQIAGTRLEPIVAAFSLELERLGLEKIKPIFYLSTEWGVASDTIAIAIPFYLARQDLTALHQERAGHVEGYTRNDILKYLRHEMGHVVLYGYKLYEDPDWIALFGSVTQPYLEQYRPEPFSRRYVQHLPGWYAQKHPEEDWAETFAVWMTPGVDWRNEYQEWPEAFHKLEYCARVMDQIKDREPLITATTPDESADTITYSVDDFYRSNALADEHLPPGLDGALRTIFEELRRDSAPDPAGRKSAAELIARLELEIVANVYRWTGHFPEQTRLLLRHIAKRAERLGLAYLTQDEEKAELALTTFVTALAMNHVQRGNYLP